MGSPGFACRLETHYTSVGDAATVLPDVEGTDMSDNKTRAIADWLIATALVERPIDETLEWFGQKLSTSGIAVDRINCSTFQRHQIMGAVDTTWERDAGARETEFVPKSVIADVNISATPAGWLARSKSDFIRTDLTLAEERSRFASFEDLHARGFTDYLIMKMSYGRQWVFQDAESDSEGVYGSFATKQEGGFTDGEIEAIETLWPAFSLYLKTSTERLLSAKLLQSYVGNLAADSILDGQVERGDGNKIQCALWYSDLRSSTALSARLPTDAYLELLNVYFDCTAGSVLEMGGDVLKLIGDGVMAIFPCETGQEGPACSRALEAARLSVVKAQGLSDGDNAPVSDLRFGIGLHMGDVILGNVGTADRLDMTVTGHSANQVTRIEALTKTMPLSVLASPQFFGCHGHGLVSIGRYPVPDFGGMTEIYSLVDK